MSKRPNIAKGDRVWVLPEWLEPGEEETVFIAAEDSTDDRGEMPRILVGTLEGSRLPFPPVERIDIAKLTTVNPVTE